jgi:predicted dehydrogenase
MAQNPIGIGFIGAGDIATMHAEAVNSMRDQGVVLVGIWNYKENDVASGGYEFSLSGRAIEFGCKAYKTVDALLADTTIHAVYILTTMETHLHYAALAIKAKKHVFIEKPVACTLEEINQIKQLATENNVIAMPGHNYIYEDGVNRMRDMIEKDKIGKIVTLNIHYNIHHDEHVCSRLPGVIRQIMTHLAYISLYLTNEIPADMISCFKASINDGSVTSENSAVVTYQLKSGAIVTLQTSFANDDHGADPWSFYIKLLGTTGSCRYSFNDFVDNRKHLVHSHSYQAYGYTIKQITKYFIENCIQKGISPLSSLDEAHSALRILEAAEKSAISKQMVKF